MIKVRFRWAFDRSIFGTSYVGGLGVFIIPDVVAIHFIVGSIRIERTYRR